LFLEDTLRSPILVTVSLAVAALAAPSTAAAACPNETLAPTAENLSQVREALLCLHNEQRAARGLPALRENTKLRRAATGHSDDMVAKGYFSHESGGETFVDRILDAGYTRRNDGWSLGENLAWGTGDLATPKNMMEAWMNSAGHRRTIVNRSYREVGFGIRLGVPKDPAVGATVTANFGAKP